MRVVIDTNVLISAAVFDRTPELVVRWIMTTEDVEWVVTPALVREYLSVLNRPGFRLSDSARAEWNTEISRLQPVLEWDGELPAIRDPHDQHVLACALASRADYLITGDKDFGAVIDLLDTQVISVQEFFKRLVVSRNP